MLIEAQWISTPGWEANFGPIHLNVPIVVTLIIIAILYVVNMLGVRVTMGFVYVTAALLMVPLFVCIVVAFASGRWNPANLTWGLHGFEGVYIALVWIYIMAWTTLGIDICAILAPEYRDTVKDTARAIKSAALFCLIVFTLLPITLAGFAGEAAVADDPALFFIQSFEELTGGGAGGAFLTFCLVAAVLLICLSSVTDSSRVLFNMGREGVTLRSVGVLNKRGIPARSLTVMLILNVVLLLILQNPLAFIVTGNLGYLITHALGTASFALLRKDQPNTPRPIRLPRIFVPLSLALSALLVVVVIVGATGFSITGYGGIRELLIALGILASSLVIWLFVKSADARRERASSAPVSPRI